MEELPLLLIPLIILIPILFFPATTAMFAMVREWIINDEDNGQLFRSYWGYYKDNYKKSVLSGLILTMAWLILAVDVFYLFDKNNSMMFLFLIMGIILFVFSINLFSITVHYHMRLLTSLKNAFLLTIGSPVLFMAVAISSGLVLYISVNIFRYLLPFLTGSLIAFLTFSAFYRNHLKLIEKSER
ncbi:YesL family protein [Sporosarcina sp. FSL K6-1508]